MVDSVDSARFDECKHELDGLLATPELAHIPIAVLANKVDLPVRETDTFFFFFFFFFFWGFSFFLRGAFRVVFRLKSRTHCSAQLVAASVTAAIRQQWP